MKSFLAAAVLFATLGVVSVVTGEEPGASDPDAAPEPPAKEGDTNPPEPLRDPTEPDPALRPLRPDGGGGGAGPGMIEPALPLVTFRGFVEVDGRAPAALLQVASGPALLVHVGDRVALGGSESGGAGSRWYTEMLVKEIQDGSARVVFSPGNKEVLIR